jgi:hypothetical protein
VDNDYRTGKIFDVFEDAMVELENISNEELVDTEKLLKSLQEELLRRKSFSLLHHQSAKRISRLQDIHVK